MKRIALFLTIASAGMSLLASDASAQRFIERPGAHIGVRRAGDWRTANQLEALSREVRLARLEIRAFRGEGRRLGLRLERVARLTVRLNHQYRRTRGSTLAIRRQAVRLRAEVADIRRDLRVRGRPRWR